MKKRVWMAVGLLLAAAPLPILLGEGHGLPPAEKWVARYNGPNNGADFAQDIAVDGSGNVYVTGYSLVSGTNYDYATIKYDTNGKQLWVRRYDGPGHGEDKATDIAVDGSGNVYVTGWSLVSANNYDYATIKYNTNGKQLWVRRFNGPSHGNDYGTDVAVDSSGNVYVTGGSFYSDTGQDFVTIKYNPSGKQLWVQRYGTPGNKSDWAYYIAVDGSGNVFISGASSVTSLEIDCVSIKYDINGKQLWVQRYGTPGETYNSPVDIAVDGAGNICILVNSRQAPGSDYDYATIKYNANGEQLWANRYNGTGKSLDAPRGLAVDGAGNVYVTGVSYGVNTIQDFATIKYSSNGKQLWVARYTRSDSSSDWAEAIAVDRSGNIYVTGASTISGSNSADYDIVTIKYTAKGKQIWVKKYNGPGHGYDSSNAIAVDGSGNVYVTGESLGSGTSIDYATIKY